MQVTFIPWGNGVIVMPLHVLSWRPPSKRFRGTAGQMLYTPKVAKQKADGSQGKQTIGCSRSCHPQFIQTDDWMDGQNNNATIQETQSENHLQPPQSQPRVKADRHFMP